MTTTRIAALSVAIPVLAVAFAACGEDPAKKAVAPPAEAQAEAIKLIKEVYGDEYAKATTIAAKQSLAKKLLAKAAETNDDLPSKFTLLRFARDTSIQAADGPTALHAVDVMAESFEIDAVEMKLTLLRKLASTAKDPTLRSGISEEALKLIAEAVSQDRFAVADQVGKIALDEARKSRSKELIARVQSQIAEATAAGKAFENAKAATAILAKDPADPAANLVVGKYQCFVKRDWNKGVPMLALGNDDALKAVAKRELEGAATTAKEAKLGDVWWSLVDKVNEIEKKPIRARAVYWYRQALPGLTGLAKDKVEKRVAGTLAVAAPAKLPTGFLNLMAKVNVERDQVGGTWQIEKTGLVCVASSTSGGTRIMMPAIVDGEYDLTVSFTRPDGKQCVSAIVPVGSHQCTVILSAWDGRFSGIERIDGKAADSNTTTVSPGGIMNGKKHELLIKVRDSEQKASIEVFFNKAPIMHWQGSESSLSINPNWAMPEKHRIGVGRCEDDVIFHSVQVKMVSGTFEWVK